MKKILFVLFIMALLIAPYVYAAQTDADNTVNSELSQGRYVITNNTETGVKTLIPTSLIIPKVSRITKITVSAITPSRYDASNVNTEAVAGIYDSATIHNAGDKYCEGEIESASNTAKPESLVYERPLKILNGAVIMQGAFTVVVVEFENAL